MSQDAFYVRLWLWYFMDAIYTYYTNILYFIDFSYIYSYIIYIKYKQLSKSQIKINKKTTTQNVTTVAEIVTFEL